MNATIIGGGPAGIMAAITAAKNGNNVTLLEKNAKLGKKLAITGGGRCNLTNSADIDEFIRQTKTNAEFLYSAFYTFDNRALMDFFENLQVPLKVENGRVFPKSDKASDIITALENELQRLGVKIQLNSPVADVEYIQNLLSQKQAVIIATGGLSYPGTGSTGDGYNWAKQLGHSCTPLQPALVPLRGRLTNKFDKPDKLDKKIADLAGLTLENVTVKIIQKNGENSPKSAKTYVSTGSILFTHNGISGPAVLDIAKYFSSNIDIFIDLLPNITAQDLEQQLLKIFAENPNKTVVNLLDLLENIPKRIVPFLVDNSTEKANNFSKVSRAKLVENIKNLEFTATGTAGIKAATVTAGGINVSEINPQTMESKKVKGLYFAGETLDVDAVTGGFNLQIAFSTGFLAGLLL